MSKPKVEPVIKRSFYVKEKGQFRLGKIIGGILFGVFFLGVLAALGVFWIMRDELDNSMLRNLALEMSWNSRKRNQTSTDKIVFDGRVDNAYAPFKDGLAVLTTNRLVCYDSIGKEIISAERHFKNPRLLSSDKNVLAYDRGGSTLVLLSDSAILLDLTTERPIITASMTKQGYIVLVTQGKGYKSVLTIMDAVGKELFRYHSPEYYIADASLSPELNMCAISFAGYEDNWVQGHVKVFDITKDDPEAIIKEPAAVIRPGENSGLITQVAFQRGGKLLAVCEKSLVFYDIKENTQETVTFEGRVTLGYSIMSTGVAVRTAQTLSSIHNRVDLYSFDGELIDYAELDDEIICQSGGGDYVTLVTSQSILVYDHSLQLKSEEPNETGARQILQRSDGTMFLIFNDYALIYSP